MLAESGTLERSAAGAPVLATLDARKEGTLRRSIIPSPSEKLAALKFAGEIRSVLSPYADGLLMRVLVQECVELVDEMFESSELLYHVIKANTDKFMWKRLKTGHLLLKARPDEKTAHLQRFEKKQENYHTLRVLGMDKNRDMEGDIFEGEEQQKVITRHLIEQLQDIVALYPEGCNMTKLKREFEMRFGYALESYAYGYESIHDLIYSLIFEMDTAKEFSLNLRSDDKWYLGPGTDTDQAYERYVHAQFSRVDVEHLILDADTQHNVEQILEKHPKGIYSTELLAVYQDLYGTPLDPKKFFCCSLDELMMINCHIFKENKGLIQKANLVQNELSNPGGRSR